MVYLFEDNRDDIIHTLFRYAYKDDINMVYAEGNNKIVDKLVEIKSSNKDEMVYIFFDLVAGNIITAREYTRLKIFIEENNYIDTVLVIPIVSMEYYLIKMLYRCGVLKDKVDNFNILAYLERKNVNELGCIRSGTIYEEKDRIHCATFELACKILLDFCSKNCLKTKLFKYEPNGWFYIKDCKCGCKQSEECNKLSLLDKSIKFLQEFECVPAGVIYKETRKKHLNYYDLISIHRKLIDEYNNDLTVQLSVVTNAHIVEYISYPDKEC